MADESLASLHLLVWTALMAAAIAAGAYLVVPIGPIPVSMQPFFIFLAGYLLGPVHGPLAVGLYLLAGVAGLPVFSGGKSGLGHILGPTGGYLFGFALAAGLCGLARGRATLVRWVPGLITGVLAIVAIYGMGALWLKYSLSWEWEKALTLGVVPFLPWDAIKIVAAVACSRYLSRFTMVPGGR